MLFQFKTADADYLNTFSWDRKRCALDFSCIHSIGQTLFTDNAEGHPEVYPWIALNKMLYSLWAFKVIVQWNLFSLISIRMVSRKWWFQQSACVRVRRSSWIIQASKCLVLKLFPSKKWMSWFPPSFHQCGIYSLVSLKLKFPVFPRSVAVCFDRC